MSLFSRPIPEVWRRVVLVLLVFVIQATLAPRMSVFGIQPSLLRIALFLFAIRSGALPAVWMGFACGFLLDLYGQGRLGCFTLAWSVTTYLVGLLDEREIYTSILTRIALLGGYCILQDVLWAWVDDFNLLRIAMFLLHNGLPSALYTMLIGAVLFTLRPTRRFVAS